MTASQHITPQFLVFQSLPKASEDTHARDWSDNEDDVVGFPPDNDDEDALEDTTQGSQTDTIEGKQAMHVATRKGSGRVTMTTTTTASGNTKLTELKYCA
jgi:hypothetical protein